MSVPLNISVENYLERYEWDVFNLKIIFVSDYAYRCDILPSRQVWVYGERIRVLTTNLSEQSYVRFNPLDNLFICNIELI